MHRFTIAPENFVKRLFSFLSAQYYCLIAKSLRKQDFWNVPILFNSLKYYIQKALKKEDGSQTGTFLLQVTVLAVVESFLRSFPEN